MLSVGPEVDNRNSGSNAHGGHNLACMRCTRMWAFPVLLLGGFACANLAHGQEIPAAKPLWRTDLRELGLGWRWESSRLLPYARVMEPLITRDSIACGRDGHIVVAFLTQEMGGRRQSILAVEASRKLHLVSLDAATGRIIATRTWPAAPPALQRPDVGANRDGNFVFLQGNGVKVYSPDLHEISKLDLPADPAGSRSGWSLSVLPRGDLAILEHDLNGSRGLQMLSATTLREIPSWNKLDKFEWASEKYLATWREDGLYVRAHDRQWGRIAEVTCPAPRQPRPVRFVNEDSLIVDSCGRIQLLRVDGQILFTTELPGGHYLTGAWGTTDGRFVALATDKMAGITIRALDMYRGPVPWRILVYDIKNGNLISTLKFNWQFACAFSPDNSGLALLSGGLVEMFSLPQPSR